MLQILPAVFYFASGVLLTMCLLNPGKQTPWNNRNLALGLGFVGILIHLYDLLPVVAQQELALGNSLSLVMGIIALLFLIAATFEPIANLGIVVMPLAGLAVVIARFGSNATTFPNSSPLFYIHLIVALLGFGLIALAVIQALLMGYQDRQLRRKNAGAVLQILPPMQTMEKLLYQMLTLGFLLLTLTLISGLFFSQQIFGKPVQLNHHVVLPILGWFIFAIFLLGHTLFGWRGRTATRWIVAGFMLLALGYIGTKFVLEVILR